MSWMFLRVRVCHMSTISWHVWRAYRWQIFSFQPLGCPYPLPSRRPPVTSDDKLEMWLVCNRVTQKEKWDEAIIYRAFCEKVFCWSSRNQLEKFLFTEWKFFSSSHPTRDNYKIKQYFPYRSIDHPFSITLAH